MTDYNQGYADGKSKVHDELRWWFPGIHAVGCGCDPCVTARKVVRTVMETLDAAAERESYGRKDAPV